MDGMNLVAGMVGFLIGCLFKDFLMKAQMETYSGLLKSISENLLSYHKLRKSEYELNKAKNKQS